MSVIDEDSRLFKEGLINARVVDLNIARIIKQQIGTRLGHGKDSDELYELVDIMLSNSKNLVKFACAAGAGFVYNLDADDILKAAEKVANTEAE